MRWLRSQDPPCEWSWDTCEAAAEGGHLELLQWLTKEGCPWDILFCLKLATVENQTHVVRWIEKEMSNADGEEGDIRRVGRVVRLSR